MMVLFMRRDMKMTRSNCTAILLKNYWFHLSMNYTRFQRTYTMILLDAARSRVHARVLSFLRKRLS